MRVLYYNWTPLHIPRIGGGVAVYLENLINSFISSVVGNIAFVFNCYYTKKILNYGFFMQMRELANIFTNGIIMGVVVTIVMIPFSDSILKLLIGIVCGIMSYTLYAIITKEQSYKDLKEIIIKKVRNGH